MRKRMAIFVCFLFLLSVFAAAEAGNETEDIEQEAADFENLSTGDEVVQEVEVSLETDEQIEDELGITPEEKAEIDEVSKTIGLKLYVLNRQLKCRLRIKIIEAQAIIGYLNGNDALQQILDDLTSLHGSIEPKTMSKEEHKSAVEKAKELIADFKETAKELIPDEEKLEVRDLINQKKEESPDNCLKLEWKVRELYNRKQFRESLKKVVEDAKQLRKDGKKLLDAAARLKELNQIRKRYMNGTIDAGEIKQQWRNETRLYGLDKAASVVKNERALLAIESVRLRKAINEAGSAGEDTAELENKLSEINSQIKEFVPGKMRSEEVKAKAALVKSKLANIEKSEKLTERLRNQAEIRQELREKLQENKQQAVQIRNEMREEVKNRVSSSGSANTGDTE